MMDQPVRVQNVTAAREPPSKIVFIRGLTRPFTLPQLKELLSHYGELVDGELWLDKIKSQCFVTVRCVDLRKRVPIVNVHPDSSIIPLKTRRKPAKHSMVADGHRRIQKHY